MHDLLPFLPGSINDVLSSITWFMPEFYLGVLFVLVLVTDLLFGKNSENLCRIIACAGLVLVVRADYQQLALLFVAGQVNGHFFFSEMLLLTHTTIDFKLLIDALAIVLILYFEWDNKLNAHNKGLSDLYTIAIGSVFGLHLMAMASNLLSIYLSIEMVSIASYLMVAYRTENAFGSEAGLKYVLFGAASSAVMLYGISLLYGFGGSLNLYTGNLVYGLAKTNAAAVSVALFLVLAGIGFKLSFVPIHFWVPDVYEGAPTPITAWLSTLPKIAGFALLINFLRPFIYFQNWTAFDFRFYLAIIGIITMIAGNFAAIMQKNIKRMLAYSSIGHTGFALMAIVTYQASGFTALVFYLAVYALANIGALALASYFSNLTGADDLYGYKGLGLKYPAASVCFVVALVSLTGLPVTAGFNAKLLVFSAAYGFYQENHNILLMALLITGALTTVVSLFYYIKIPLYLFLKRSENPIVVTGKSYSILVLSIIIAVAILVLGLQPGLLVNHI